MFPIFRIKTHSQYTQLTFSWTFQCYPCVLILLFSCFSEVTPLMIGFFFYLTLLKHLLQTYEFNWKLFHRHFFMFWSFLFSDSWVISGAWNIYYFFSLFDIVCRTCKNCNLDNNAWGDNLGTLFDRWTFCGNELGARGIVKTS